MQPPPLRGPTGAEPATDRCADGDGGGGARRLIPRLTLRQEAAGGGSPIRAFSAVAAHWEYLGRL